MKSNVLTKVNTVWNGLGRNHTLTVAAYMVNYGHEIGVKMTVKELEEYLFYANSFALSHIKNDLIADLFVETDEGYELEKVRCAFDCGEQTIPKITEFEEFSLFDFGYIYKDYNENKINEYSKKVCRYILNEVKR